jgi:hypothetical protein
MHMPGRSCNGGPTVRCWAGLGYAWHCPTRLHQWRTSASSPGLQTWTGQRCFRAVTQFTHSGSVHAVGIPSRAIVDTATNTKSFAVMQTNTQHTRLWSRSQQRRVYVCAAAVYMHKSHVDAQQIMPRRVQ